MSHPLTADAETGAKLGGYFFSSSKLVHWAGRGAHTSPRSGRAGLARGTGSEPGRSMV